MAFVNGESDMLLLLDVPAPVTGYRSRFRAITGQSVSSMIGSMFSNVVCHEPAVG
jgi:hypothetical protein